VNFVDVRRDDRAMSFDAVPIRSERQPLAAEQRFKPWHEVGEVRMQCRLAARQMHALDAVQYSRRALEILPGVMPQDAIDADSATAVRAAPIAMRSDFQENARRRHADSLAVPVLRKPSLGCSVEFGCVRRALRFRVDRTRLCFRMRRDSRVWRRVLDGWMFALVLGNVREYARFPLAQEVRAFPV
jgi:hypothetical protein